MAYASDSNGNGKKPLSASLLGAVATEYLGATIASPLFASAFRVIARQPALTPWPGVNAGMAVKVPLRAPVIIAAPKPVVRPTPAINIVSLPNGTAIPAPVAPAYTPPVTRWEVSPFNPANNPAYGPSAGPPTSGGGMGPPPSMNAPIVGTLPEDDGSTIQTAGLGSLAGLTSNPMVLGLVALAAFMFLGDSKPKRRRR